MDKQSALASLMKECDIYFDDALISKEHIMKKYIDFLLLSLDGEQHSASVALHTGSVCFGIISLVMATLGCVSIDGTNAEEIISSLNVGDMVIYKNERHRWHGIEESDGKKFIKLEQDGRGKNGPITRSILYDANKGRIKPYFGESETTDGRGIRKGKSDRADFISFIFDIPQNEVPSFTGTSAVIVTERETFRRIADGLIIGYGEKNRISLLDIVTASYFTDSGEEHRYGRNPAKTEPVLKITGKVSTARDLILSRQGNPIVGLMVIGESAVAKGGSELADLLGRKSLKFAHVSVSIDFDDAENIVETNPDVSLFACTKEFLLNNALPVCEKNPLTVELDRQVGNIINNTVATVNVEGGCSWEDMKRAREALCAIKHSDWHEDEKKSFVITAHSLLNLLMTAVFPLQKMESAVLNGKLRLGVTSPAARISELWDMSQLSGTMEYSCACVVDIIEKHYKALLDKCPKYDKLVQLATVTEERNVIAVVPKAYYIDILMEDECLADSGITVTTANRFDPTCSYDEIIAVGDIFGKRFDPLRCRAAEYITVLLYECETHLFTHRSKKVRKFENKLNMRSRVAGTESSMEGISTSEETIDSQSMNAYIEDTKDLERYIEEISNFDIKKFITGTSAAVDGIQTSEVCVVGRSASGEQILFSKYYDAVVFNPIQGTVTETEPEKLSDGDVLVFAKRDDYTRNMVDYIYERLQHDKHLSYEVLDATEKAYYWKEALREYKSTNELSYRDIAIRLKKLGSSLQEVSVRQWLIDESHIVGPRDERTLEQIAELTGDEYLLSNPSAYFEACRIVRRQRIEILGLIGKAIARHLSGHKPSNGSLLEVVYENVGNLSESLELESVEVLDEPVLVPINLVNKPLARVETGI